MIIFGKQYNLRVVIYLVIGIGALIYQVIPEYLTGDLSMAKFSGLTLMLGTVFFILVIGVTSTTSHDIKFKLRGIGISHFISNHHIPTKYLVSFVVFFVVFATLGLIGLANDI